MVTHAEAWETLVTVLWGGAWALAGLAALCTAIGIWFRARRVAVAAVAVVLLACGAATLCAGQRRSAVGFLECRHHVMDLAGAVEAWSENNQGRAPEHLDDLVPLYLPGVPTCPTTRGAAYRYEFAPPSNGLAVFTISCSGDGHRIGCDHLHDLPRYTASEDLVPALEP